MTPTARLRHIGLLVGVLALSVGVVVAASSTQISGPAGVREGAERVRTNRTLVVGDSAIAALRWVPRADTAVVGFDHILDLESCRRLATSSCNGREGRTPPNVVEVVEADAGWSNRLVVATGYNDSDRGFAAAFEQVVDAARANGFESIVWYTLRSEVDYVSPADVGNHETFATNNATLRRLVASGEYPDVVIADWGGYSAEQIDWFATDGVHYRAVGAWAASDYLSRLIAHLDQRPCPVPTEPGETPEDPCPHPDETGPVADVEALYPIGSDGVLCYEVGVDRRFECRTDFHVLQIERELRWGMSGDDVEALQVRLERLGFYDSEVGGVDPEGNPIPPDPVGSYETHTWYAVGDFQRAHDLSARWCVDIETLEALGFDTTGVGGNADARLCSSDGPIPPEAQADNPEELDRAGDPDGPDGSGIAGRTVEPGAAVTLEAAGQGHGVDATTGEIGGVPNG